MNLAKKTSYKLLSGSIVLIVSALLSLSTTAQRPAVANNPMNVDPAEYLDKITLPPGFKISIYAKDVMRARSMDVGANDTVYVGTRGVVDRKELGKVFAVVDSNKDFVADDIKTIAEGLNVPNGVALNGTDLYIAEIGTIQKLENIQNNLDSPPKPVVVTEDYPDETYHGWKFIRFGPDGKLYVPVGAPCNTCERDEIFASITRIDADGKNREIVAHGVRNSVGFDWHPQTNEMWFTDNGRDMIDDNTPPEELNRVTKAGEHFGFPYRYGKDYVDDAFKTDKKAEEFVAPMAEMPAHTAGLGMRFYTGSSFPAEYKYDVFIAYHCSWNRSKPAGYYVMRVDMENGEVKGTEVFAGGWLIDEKYWGRPVDIEFLSDGSMLVSDDHANVIYRISYEG